MIRARSTRRTLLVGAAAFAATGALRPDRLLADSERESHGLSIFGDLKYGPDFKHFDYADPAAPKGGMVRFGAQGGFDNFNIVVAGVKGDLESQIPLIYDTLLAQA